ncbi:MAG: hypothetical protein MZW92_43310 [Comamonadaceae bacterium]|nr:hypothetical protein [Comamonadaceae bacterium]
MPVAGNYGWSSLNNNATGRFSDEQASSRACALAFAVSLAPLTASAQVAWSHDPASRHRSELLGIAELSLRDLRIAVRSCPSGEADRRLVEVGRKQTPIDIVRPYLPFPPRCRPIVTQYVGTPFIVENTGHVIEVPVEPGSSNPRGAGRLSDCFSSTCTRRAGTWLDEGPLPPGELHLVPSEQRLRRTWPWSASCS